MEKAKYSLSGGKTLLIALTLVFALGAVISARNVVVGTQASTQAIDHILTLYNLKNEGAQSLSRYTKEHPFLGAIISSPIQHTLKLPSHEESSEILYGDVPHLLKTVREQSHITAWWSWFLLSLSLAYAASMIVVERSFTTRPVIFAFTTISVTFFFIGIIAPAMVIWTAPNIPLETGNLNFVVQHEVRGIAAIIWELFQGGHWVIGGFLLLFSIITPLTKASLTYFVTASRSHALNFRIGQFLHAIGKWSMADVFVAAVLLALYALKFQEATKSIPCLGLYYFIGYCLLSLSTTELLVHSDIVSREERKSNRFGPPIVGALAAGVLCFTAGSALYTYEQYTVNLKQHSKIFGAPHELDNSDLVLPVHK